MSSMMLIEKYETKEEIEKIIIELRRMTKSKERIEWLKEVVEYILGDVLKERKEKILKIIGGEEEEMEEWLARVKRTEERRIREEERKKAEEEKRRKEYIKQCKKEALEEGKKEGIKEGVLETLVSTIKNMLKYHEDEEKIMKYTNAKREDIEKIKKELEMQVN